MKINNFNKVVRTVYLLEDNYTIKEITPKFDLNTEKRLLLEINNDIQEIIKRYNK